MPHPNRFRHQRIRERYPAARYEMFRPGPPVSPGDAEFPERMQDVARQFHDGGVRAIYLVHGTFVGDSPVGVGRTLRPFLLGTAGPLRRGTKRMIDVLFGEVGNYTPRYARLLEDALAIAGEPAILVRRHIWSGENNHLGRALAAVGLLDELCQLELDDPARIQVWGHSHGANVLAIVSNLLAGERRDLEPFFAALSPVAVSRDYPPIAHVRDWLLQGGGAAVAPRLDMVTFGMPLLYGWDSEGYGKLLHFVHHRPFESYQSYRTRAAISAEEVLAAADGDYVQQWGMAGSNFSPLPICWKSWTAERRLAGVLARHVPRSGWIRRIQVGQRIGRDGKTLLIDYLHGDRRATALYGHGCYTLRRWLHFHAQTIAEEFYAEDTDAATS